MADMPNNANDDAGTDADGNHVFAEQVTRFFNGPLQSGDLESLRERLRIDPTARRLFVQIASLDGLLTERSLAHKNSLRVATDLLDDLTNED